MPTIYIGTEKSNSLSHFVPRHPGFENLGARSSSEQSARMWGRVAVLLHCMPATGQLQTLGLGGERTFVAPTT